MHTIEAIEDICYRFELDRAERHMDEAEDEWVDEGCWDKDDPDCPGWELGECENCPHDGACQSFEQTKGETL